MKASNYQIVLALLGTAVLGSGSAVAMPPGPMPLAVYDTDGDGKVSQEEFYRAREARWADLAREGRLLRNLGNAPAFESMDSNDDGFLNEKELTAGQALHMQQRFQRRQAMRPGRPYPGGRQGPPSFSEFDRDGDGMISEQEFEQTRGERRASWAAPGYRMRQAPYGPSLEEGETRDYRSPMGGEFMPGRYRYPCPRW